MGSRHRRWQQRPVAASRHTVWLGRMIGLVLASWLLFGTSLSWAGTNAPMCGADATSIEAPPVSPNAKSGQIAAPCSPDLKRLMGAVDDDSDHSNAIWVAQAQVDHGVLLGTTPQLGPLPDLLLATPAPGLAPVRPTLGIYRPPRA